jgi:hypothetical protein
MQRGERISKMLEGVVKGDGIKPIWVKVLLSEPPFTDV